jgi:hypothetical protein
MKIKTRTFTRKRLKNEFRQKPNTSFRKFAMSFKRPKTLSEAARRILDGGTPGYEIKDFLHEFKDRGDIKMLIEKPPDLKRHADGKRLNAFLQALAVYLATQVDAEPPEWTRPPIQLPEPWFASPGTALRNYLLISSPAPFRTRNLFIDEDSLHVV